MVAQAEAAKTATTFSSLFDVRLQMNHWARSQASAWESSEADPRGSASQSAGRAGKASGSQAGAGEPER